MADFLSKTGALLSAPEVTQKIGSPGANEIRGRVYVPNEFYLPLRNPDFIPRNAGALIWQDSAKLFQYFDGSQWRSLGAGLTSNDFQTDIDTDIIGDRDGVNRIFLLTKIYAINKTMVYINGQRVYRGANYDYIESGVREITFNYPINSMDRLLADYFTK